MAKSSSPATELVAQCSVCGAERDRYVDIVCVDVQENLLCLPCAQRTVKGNLNERLGRRAGVSAGK